MPEHIKPFRENKDIVCIDQEIVSVIKHLWEHDIITLGCCQGDDKLPRSLVIGDDYSDSEIANIRKLIAEKDTTPWEIFQWRIMNVDCGRG